MVKGIRTATVEDWPALERLWRQVDELHAQLLPSYFRRTEGPMRTRSELVEILQSPSDTLLVADVEGEVGGFVHVQIYDTPALPTMTQTRRGHIEDLVVDLPRRRGGLGTALMEAAARWAKGEGASEIVLTVWSGNHAAESFYQRLGYAPLSRVLHKGVG